MAPSITTPMQQVETSCAEQIAAYKGAMVSLCKVADEAFQVRTVEKDALVRSASANAGKFESALRQAIHDTIGDAHTANRILTKLKSDISEEALSTVAGNSKEKGLTSQSVHVRNRVKETIASRVNYTAYTGKA